MHEQETSDVISSLRQVIRAVESIRQNEFEVARYKPNAATFAYGFITIADDNRIVIGFHLDVAADVISEIAQALIHFGPTVSFYFAPAFVDHDESGNQSIILGAEACARFGKVMIQLADSWSAESLNGGSVKGTTH